MRAVSCLLCAIILMTVAVPEGVRSAECGGAVPCRCGDSITGRRYVLSTDLGPCPGDGLILRENAALDCRGHVIRGAAVRDSNEAAPATFGTILDRTASAVVRDCQITGFRYGIELREARDSTIQSVTVFGNGNFDSRVGYGIHLSRSRSNTIRDSVVRENADEGIHIGKSSDDNTLVANTAYDNGREDIYVLSARGTRVLRNRAGGDVSAALYMKHATLSRVEANTFEDRPVVVRGRSSANVFVDNAFDGGLTFQAYVDANGVSAPTANLVRGGRITGKRPCLAFRDSGENRIEAVSLDGCARIASYSELPTTNHFVDTAMEDIALDLSGGSTFRIMRRVRVEVLSASGDAVSAAHFELTDGSGHVSDGPRSGGSGAAVLEVPTHLVSPVNLVRLTPVHVRVSADGYVTKTVELNEPLPPHLSIKLVPVR